MLASVPQAHRFTALLCADVRRSKVKRPISAVNAASPFDPNKRRDSWGPSTCQISEGETVYQIMNCIL